MLLPAPREEPVAATWSFFDPAAAAPPNVEGPVEWVEPPYQFSDRYVLDEDGVVLEIARERVWSRWWNGLSQNDRRFYFGSMLVFVVSTFLYCLGVSALTLTPALQPPALVVAPTGTPTPTQTPFVIGLTPTPNEPLGPTPTFGVPVFFLATATPRSLPDDPDPTSTPPVLPATSTPSFFVPTPARTPTGILVATPSPVARTPTLPAVSPAPGTQATTPTVPPANATYTPVPTGTRPPALPTGGAPIPTSTPATLVGPLVPSSPTATVPVPIPPLPTLPTPRP